MIMIAAWGAMNSPSIGMPAFAIARFAPADSLF
jgi:hypothetical protein